MATVKFSIERTLSSETAPASGLKGLAFDSMPSLLYDEPAATYGRASDERGRYHTPRSGDRPDLPDAVGAHADIPIVKVIDVRRRPPAAGRRTDVAWQRGH